MPHWDRDGRSALLQCGLRWPGFKNLLKLRLSLNNNNPPKSNMTGKTLWYKHPGTIVLNTVALAPGIGYFGGTASMYPLPRHSQKRRSASLSGSLPKLRGGLPLFPDLLYGYRNKDTRKTQLVKKVLDALKSPGGNDTLHMEHTFSPYAPGFARMVYCWWSRSSFYPPHAERVLCNAGQWIKD